MSAVASLLDQVDRFVVRIIQDAINEGTAVYWRRRADQLEAAQSRPEDFTGLSSVEEIAAQDLRLSERARACRAAAEIAIIGGRSGS
ncbi:hypothetical protein [Nocardioides stalactiti]|uniref:hypothetical protein n=1 Tax=Nocardioides stalactiti TaxID=2755356 RepID=UPI001600E77C|nr:hypothetical protein [Nocardioides stalactiti]